MKKVILSLLFVIAWLTAGCSEVDPYGDPATLSPELVSPVVEVSLGQDGAVDIALGFANETDRPLAAQENLAGQWVLLDEEGELRGRGRLLIVGPLDAGETEYPLVWSGVLAPGTYVLQWGAPSAGTLIAELNVSGDGLGVGVGRQETFDEFLVQ